MQPSPTNTATVTMAMLKHKRTHGTHAGQYLIRLNFKQTKGEAQWKQQRCYKYQIFQENVIRWVCLETATLVANAKDCMPLVQ